MDKRIIKTKNNIKRTLIEMLKDKKYEDITVKELCECAETSRITFYTHYSDKTELVSDIFEDMRKKATNEYNKLQAINNPNGDIVADYINILDAILSTYYGNIDFFMHTRSDVSPTLSHMYYSTIEAVVRCKLEKDRDRLNPVYPMHLVFSFICSGLRGFINEARRDGFDDKDIRTMACEMLKNLLENDIVRKS